VFEGAVTAMGMARAGWQRLASHPGLYSETTTDPESCRSRQKCVKKIGSPIRGATYGRGPELELKIDATNLIRQRECEERN
jgi:hypothetical protein